MIYIDLSKRPKKGKIKNVFIKKGCPIKPFWRENSDIHHVSPISDATIKHEML